MKLLLAVLSIATAGTPATATKLKDITISNFSVDYKLDIGTHSSKYGYFELRAPPKYVSHANSISILLNSTMLLNGVGISGEAATNTVIKSGYVMNFGPGVQEVYAGAITYAIRPQPAYVGTRFTTNTYLVNIFPCEDAKEGVKVTVVVEHPNDAQQNKTVEGQVVSQDGVLYVMISELIFTRGVELNISIPGESQTSYKCNPNNGSQGPFVALEIEVEQD